MYSTLSQTAIQTFVLIRASLARRKYYPANLNCVSYTNSVAQLKSRLMVEILSTVVGNLSLLCTAIKYAFNRW